jgi:solute carrier family 39 (zinc transporter), member 9
MSLSPAQLRFISSLGVGVLVGTSLIVIIPEGIGAAISPGESSHLHKVRSVAPTSWTGIGARDMGLEVPIHHIAQPHDDNEDLLADIHSSLVMTSRAEEADDHDHAHEDEDDHDEHAEFPGFEIGISMILGFVLMFLIDRIPKHATERMDSTPQTHQFSLDTLGPGGPPTANGDTSSSHEDDEAAEGLMGSLKPTPRGARTLATTLGLVIHAAADGIAMGASATAKDTKMSFVIFFAIMIHKAPAAFGLTSVLLRQGLSKRAARGHLVVFSLAAPAGALVTWMLVTLLGGGGGDEESGTYWTGMLLLFSGGTFL